MGEQVQESDCISNEYGRFSTTRFKEKSSEPEHQNSEGVIPQIFNEKPVASLKTADIPTQKSTLLTHQLNISSMDVATIDAPPIQASPTIMLRRSQRVRRPPN